MARVKSFFGLDLKTGGYIIGYLSLFANILYLILDVEAVLVTVLEQSNEKREIFGSFINQINASSCALPIILFALVAALYGAISSALLICGVCSANRKRVLWWLIYQPIAVLSVIAIAVYSIVVRANSPKPFYHCAFLETMYLIFLVTLILYVALHIYFFIVIIELYLQLKAEELAKVGAELEVVAVKEEELQLLEAPKAETADETDKPEEKTEEEKAKEAEAKEETKTSKIRCPEVPKCPSLKCPSWGNCVGPDNFE